MCGVLGGRRGAHTDWGVGRDQSETTERPGLFMPVRGLIENGLPRTIGPRSGEIGRYELTSYFHCLLLSLVSF